MRWWCGRDLDVRERRRDWRRRNAIVIASGRKQRETKNKAWPRREGSSVEGHLMVGPYSPIPFNQRIASFEREPPLHRMAARNCTKRIERR